MFRFGSGLSYTKFTHTVLSPHVRLDAHMLRRHVRASRHRPHVAPVVVRVQVRVRNTGEREGEEVVLALLKPPNAGLAGEPIILRYAIATSQ